ncbi:MAG TPA: GGDEF domain-containing protein [Steroidobacteraceae bacterium]
MRTANADIALQISAAAIEGDRARVKQLLSDLLRSRKRRTDEDLFPLLRALEDLFLMLHSMALTDELTGLYNRRGFLRRAVQLLETAGRTVHGALLIYVDVDQLRHVNDSWGHDAGDELLMRAAQVLRDVSGNHALVGRLGGDEFAVLDASGHSGSGKQIARRIQSAVETCNASTADPALSLSIGCVELDPRKPGSVLALIAQGYRDMHRDKVRDGDRTGNRHTARLLRRPECGLQAIR